MDLQHDAAEYLQMLDQDLKWVQKLWEHMTVQSKEYHDFLEKVGFLASPNPVTDLPCVCIGPLAREMGTPNESRRVLVLLDHAWQESQKHAEGLLKWALETREERDGLRLKCGTLSGQLGYITAAHSRQVNVIHVVNYVSSKTQLKTLIHK